MTAVILQFLQDHALELTALLLELIVLIAILREVRELKAHHAALQRHEEHLTAARPLMSTLYSGDEEAMALAISFTDQANSIYALGAISTLAETERPPGETAAQHSSRLASLPANKLAYVTATLNAITRGCRYRRIIDFSPRGESLRDNLELLANINFFLRAYDTPRTKQLELQLYHSPHLITERGDFHFRVSDRQLVLRVGGHGNGYANAALLLTDTRVIDEFRRYFESMLVSPGTRLISYEELQRLRDRLLAGDIASACSVIDDLGNSLSLNGSGRQNGDTSVVRAGVLTGAVETAVIMAAGRGTRMGPMSDDHQKCMLPVHGRPLLRWILDAFLEEGVSRIYVLTGYRSEEVEQYVEELRLAGKVQTVRVTPTSTASALTEIRHSLGGHFWYAHANVIVPKTVLGELRTRYTDFESLTTRFPAAALAAAAPDSGLTHAIIRRDSSETGSVRFAARTGVGGRPLTERMTDVLSLGLGIMNAACVNWRAPDADALMAEGLITATSEHPLLYHIVSDFIHVETSEDYRNLVRRTAALNDAFGGERR